MIQTMAKFVKWVMLVLGGLLLLALIAVPFFGVLRVGIGPQYVAQLLLEFFGPPLFVILSLAAVAISWLWWKKRNRVTLVFAILSGLGTIACGVTLGGYVGVAYAHGLSINPVQALWPDLKPDGTSPAEEFTYDRFEGQDVSLLVYRPAKRQRPAPILVRFHGGGWVQGSAKEREGDDRWFADQGYLVVDVNYSLSSTRRHLWNVTHQQLGCSLVWIAKNAHSLGGDPKRLAIYGESAGGNLVLNVAHLANGNARSSRCGGRVPQISAVISVYPPVDMAALHAHEVATIYPLAYIGGPPTQFPDRYASVSPISYVRGPGAPTLLLTGLDDSMVPVDDTLRYVKLRRAAGHDIELIAIPRAGHAFDFINGSIGNQIFRESSIAFLKKHNLQP